ncbi:hypothetical protein [Streptomyces sp. NPDC050504]|uniref:hypothetical protein n=1 Tax=Streptomyces sp. NPDC050504 TaxID=3365618 RepID=UPI0037ABACD2
MESAQRVVHRSGLFSRLLLALVVLALLFFAYTVVRENLSARTVRDWPWRFRLMDLQSATAALIATSGAALARAQYARTVRPVLGHFGRTVADVAPEGRLAWACHLFNGAQDVATVTDMGYWVVFTSSARAQGAEDASRWLSSQETDQLIVRRGLVAREDFWLDFIGTGRPIPGQGLMFLGWFTEPALREVETVYVRVRVIDRVGDTHERTIDLLKGVNRTPRYPDAPPF